MENNNKHLSEQISDFVKLLNSVKPSFDYMYDKMKEQDSLTQDILHKLELEDMKYKERAKLATKLQKSRRMRHTYKDCVEELEPIKDFAEENRKLINSLTQLIGAVRKAEKYHTDRKYFLRIIKEE